MFRELKSAYRGLILSLGGLLITSAAAAQSERNFTRSELSLLDQGKLVTRPTSKQQGGLRLIGGSSWQVINAPVDVVWKAVLDANRYPRMLPRVDRARIVGRQGDRFLVYIHQAAGPVTASYYLHARPDHRRRDLSFTLDETRPHSIRAAWGFFNVRPYRGNMSILSYGILADVGDGLVTGLLRPTVHRWLLKVPTTIKRFVEGSGRSLYLASIARPSMQ